MRTPEDWDRSVGEADVVREVFDHVPTLLLALDGPRLEFAATNAAYRAVMTKARIGASVWDLAPEVADQQVYQMFLRVYETGEPFHASEWRVQIDLDGSGPQEVYFDMHVIPRYDADGSIRGVQILGSDASERVRMRQEAEAQVAAISDQYERARDSVTVMQAALLASSVPVLPGLDVAAEYLVAADDTAAGGDWFDAVPLPDGSVGLVVGDVVGHGVKAAAVMAQLRTAVRMRLLGGGDLAATLADVDAFVPFVVGAKGATVCLVRVDTEGANLQYCTAGHPPPLVIDADGTPHYLEPSGSGPLGTGSTFAVGTEQFDVGDTVVLYSDGVIERPGRALPASTTEFAALAANIVAGRVFPVPDDGRPVDRLCNNTLELLLRETGYADDVTMLAAQARDPVEGLHVVVPAVASSGATVLAQLRKWLGAVGASDSDTLLVTHALIEYVENVVEHAYPPGGGGDLRVDAGLDRAGVVHASVTDHGQWKTPSRAPHAMHGRGLFMAAGLIMESTVSHDSTGTTAALKHRLSRPVRIVTEPGLTQQTSRPGSPAFLFDVGSDAPDYLVVCGDVDGVTAPTVGAAIDAQSRHGTIPTTIDLSAVTHLGSAGVAVLFDLMDRARRQGVDVKLIAPPGGAAHHVLTLVGLPITPSPDIDVV